MTADVLRRIGSLTDPQLEESGFFADGVQALGPDGAGWRVRTRLFADDQGRAGGARLARELGDRRTRVLGAGRRATDRSRRTTFQAGLRDRRGRRCRRQTHSRDRAPEPVLGSRADRRHVQRTRRMRAAARPITMVEGDDQVTHRVGERTWRIGVNGFWQAHRAAPAAYARTVVEMVAGDMRDAVAWDLYGGAGIYAGALLDESAAQVHVVDSDAGAIGAACATFAEDPRLVVYQGDVAATAADLPKPGIVASIHHEREPAARSSTRSPPPARTRWCTSPATSAASPATSASSPPTATTCARYARSTRSRHPPRRGHRLPDSLANPGSNRKPPSLCR